MTERERFLRTMRYEPVDQRPLLACRFTGSGLPGSVEPPDRHLQPNAAGQWVVRPR